MAGMVTVTARTDFVYQTRVLVAGEQFECRPIEAAMLRYQGKVALASDPQPKITNPEPSSQPAPPTRRRRRLFDASSQS